MSAISRFRCACFAVFLLLALGAFAQTQTQLIPRSVLFGNPERSSPQISPDGALLAYLAPDQGVLNIWVRTLGKTDDRAITNDRKRGIRNLFWQYDSKNILYAQDQNGDENWRVHQTTLPPDRRATLLLSRKCAPTSSRWSLPIRRLRSYS